MPAGRVCSPAVDRPAPEDRTPPTPPLTVGVVFVRNLLSGVRSKGLDGDAFLREAGIAPEALADDDAHVTLQQYGDLLRVLMVRLDDETLGFLTRKSKPGSSLLQARSALGAPNLETAIRRIAHVFGLLHDDVSLRLLQSGDEGGLGLEFHDAAVQRNPSCTSSCCAPAGGCSPGWSAANCRPRAWTSPSRAPTTRRAWGASSRRRGASMPQSARSGSRPGACRCRSAATRPRWRST